MTVPITGPTWSIGGFQARVRMSKDFHLFIVTEGPNTDPYFYDRLARTSNDKRVRKVKTYTVGQITRKFDGSPGAGGKRAVLDAYASTRANGGLTAVNSGGRRSIVFCVDRDVDRKHEAYEADMHFCVTTMRDVEAEVFLNSDRVAALQHMLSIDYADALQRARPMLGWVERLAVLWKEWILLGAVVANAPSSPPGDWAIHSLVNVPAYGPVDADKLEIHEGRLQNTFGSKRKYTGAKRDARVLLRERRSLGGLALFVKGKWLPGWVAEVVGSTAAEKTQLKRDSLMAFSGALDYSGTWADSYRLKFDEAMSRKKRLK